MPDAPEPVRRRRAARIAALALAGGTIVGGAMLWTQRIAIEQRLLDGMLAKRGVAGTYRIERFGLDSQTLVDVRLGDPARPDLTVRRAVMHYRLGLAGPYVSAVEAEGMRLSGDLRGGQARFGALDRLLPSTGGPFRLPDLPLTLADARIALATDAGPVTLDLAGQGNPARAFAGTTRLSAPRLKAAGCTALDVTGALAVRTNNGRPAISGPLAARGIACGTTRVARPALALDLGSDAAFATLGGRVGVRSGPLSAAEATARTLTGTLILDGPLARPAGRADLALGDVSRDGLSADRLRYSGRFATERGLVLDGAVRAMGAHAPLSLDPRVADSSPAGPAVRGVVSALGRATAAFDAAGSGRIALGAATTFRLDRLTAASRSGARLALAAPVASGGPLAATIRLAGGGLPDTAVSLRQAGGGVVGVARIAPIVAPDGRLALGPVRLAAGPDGWRVETRATMDGPLGGGRIAGLSLPVVVRGRGGSAIANTACVPLDFVRLEIAGIAFGRSRIAACPHGGAMLRVGPGGASGGLRVATLRIRGQVGRQPLTLVGQDVSARIDRPGFAARDVAVRLGEGASPTRLDIDRLDGRFLSDGIAGTFAGLSGAIANVPLDMTQGAGDWRLASAVLTLAGRLQVADAAAPPRFVPLIVPDVALRLEGGRIAATGTLTAPGPNRPVAVVTIRHDLSAGRGDSLLDVTRLAFDEGLQPEQLTRLTLGVVANVRGTVTGQGRIRWDGNGVTSDGDFATRGMNLAAAFGPVTGIDAKLRFSDLLALATPPGQVVTVASINPGIEVEDGVIRYQLLRDQRVRIEGGRWPFSGGTLTLEPGEVDLGQAVPRRLTFRIDGMDAAKFVQRFEFDNLSVTGIFDGTLPMVFDTSGGRIVGGQLAVRPGGGRLAYVGEVSNAKLGTFGKLAFDALKSIRYSSLVIGLDGRLDGEIVSKVSFDGRNTGTPRTRKGILAPLMNLPFRFAITIRAPFRGLLNSARSLNDPRALIGQTIRPEAVQPPASEEVR